ncbi:MAG TPA: DUF368 domain-containing protein [Ornithinimicrobium sp.]|nr:DUF368 domain-containing protein [Ornithinimicrobium sp.]
MPPVTTSLLHAARGTLVGAAEVVPGISGGTVMLIVGIYERLVTSAGHFVGGLRLLLPDRPAGRSELARVRWDVVVPVVIGMVPAALLTAALVAPVAERHPVPTLGLFLGMSAAAVLVPATLVGRAWTPRYVALAAAAAVVAAVLVGLPPQHLPAHPAVVFPAAAVAVCALALPGLSGSFLLLTLGLYQPTLAALNERDWSYLLVFGAGAAVGLASFLRLLQRLLEHHHATTLVVLTGVIVGALRALWPWQDDDRGLLAPDGEVALTITLAVVGALAVLVLAVLGRRAE